LNTSNFEQANLWVSLSKLCGKLQMFSDVLIIKVYVIDVIKVLMLSHWAIYM